LKPLLIRQFFLWETEEFQPLALDEACDQEQLIVIAW
jgi:hypothetical protein